MSTQIVTATAHIYNQDGRLLLIYWLLSFSIGTAGIGRFGIGRFGIGICGIGICGGGGLAGEVFDHAWAEDAVVGAMS